MECYRKSNFCFLNTIHILCFYAAKIVGLKKSCAKGDKKKKKEVAEEIAKLEVQLDQRHEQEIQNYNSSLPVDSVIANVK
jgi:OTU domain-containing protein 6